MKLHSQFQLHSFYPNLIRNLFHITYTIILLNSCYLYVGRYFLHYVWKIQLRGKRKEKGERRKKQKEKKGNQFPSQVFGLQERKENGLLMGLNRKTISFHFFLSNWEMNWWAREENKSLTFTFLFLLLFVFPLISFKPNINLYCFSFFQVLDLVL